MCLFFFISNVHHLYFRFIKFKGGKSVYLIYKKKSQVIKAKRHWTYPMDGPLNSYVSFDGWLEHLIGSSVTPVMLVVRVESGRKAPAANESSHHRLAGELPCSSPLRFLLFVERLGFPFLGVLRLGGREPATSEMAQAVEDWYKQMPIITRSYLTAAVVTTIGCTLEV